MGAFIVICRVRRASTNVSVERRVSFSKDHDVKTCSVSTRFCTFQNLPHSEYRGMGVVFKGG